MSSDPNTPPPASVGDVLGAAAEPAVVRFNGTDWKFGPPTVGVLSRLEMLVYQKAEEELDALKAAARPERWAEHNAAFLAAVRARSHRVGGELYEATMGGPDGNVLFVLSLVREHKADATEEQVRALIAGEPDKVRRAVVLVTPSFLRLVGAAKGATPGQVNALLERMTPYLKS